jgi:ribonucleoside-diphosphate reductase alpha chain
MKFRQQDGGFDAEAFAECVRIMLTAQEILIDRGSYPTKEICKNSHNLRPLGLGYTNLGALIMSEGMAYDSDEARLLCGILTSLLQAAAALTSIELAETKGAFTGFGASHNMVMQNHIDAYRSLGYVQGFLMDYVAQMWENVEKNMHKGFRNAQLTCLAPTGTISFMMGADTTGIEPELSLVKTKHLVGGGTLRIVNQSVTMALDALGYTKESIPQIIEYLEKEGKMPDYITGHVFDTALGDNAIPWQGHVKMMAAAQPFISGAISKTVNLPESATAEDIKEVYFAAWRSGLKSIAIYRDNSKAHQPMSTLKNEPTGITQTRERLPDTRDSVTHKFSINGQEGYFTVGLYPDGRPGELFLSVSKEGSTIGGLMDCFGIAISIGLQYGVPLSEFVRKFEHTSFEPMGYTDNKDIRIAKSIIDYIFRWLSNRFLATSPRPIVSKTPTLDSPLCTNCGAMTVRAGSCTLCYACGTSGGCS